MSGLFIESRLKMAKARPCAMLEVLIPSLLTTVQDSGRFGWQAFGVPRGGPMDWFAHRAANLLAANPPEAAALEIGYTSAEFLALDDCLIAAAGPGFALFINDRPMRMEASIFVRKNGRIRLEKQGPGNWAYLAAHGGIQTPLTLGSRSSYIPARLGAPPLAPGDRLPLGTARAPLPDLAARALKFPVNYALNPTLRVLPGPQADSFSKNAFYAAEYSLSPTSDRTGYRLNGPPLEPLRPGELLSEGLTRGCIQIPPDGQPIVMQADCPPTGGYPKIGAVITADQPLLAQAPIGTGRIRFVETTIEEAQNALRKWVARLKTAIEYPEETWPLA
ncbi:MAG: biotin-dependent carboxyltransferase family protein [Anaerolineales bacterium]|nr:biotin-dependent carboxyltransferase family protein [Anaerolineales bacterium]